ncbi:MAG TPA: type II toxin-antitoxin system VapC family toxin [Chloroflexota bacterium]|nr:type II toxin-antitoxin system VapC family toxin [Chloroflexota bacterium]
MPERRHARGIVDTSVLIDPPPESALPEEASIAAITLAELAAGVHATRDPNERAARQDRLQRVEATLEALPFDAGAARAYGRVFAAISGAGRKARGKRAIDLLIAATALAVGLPLYTRNVGDFSGLEGVVEIVEIRA